MAEKIKISKSTVDRLPLPESGQPIFWDTNLVGFGVRTGSKRKTYIVQKKINGRDVKVTLGAHGHITAEQARKMAMIALADMTQGVNPTDQKREARAKSVTLQEALTDFLNARKSLKPRTIRDMNYAVTTYFSDWQTKPIAKITKEKIAKRHKDIGSGKGGKAQANQAMRYLRAIFNFAISKYADSKGDSIIQSNPVSILSQTRAWYRIERRQTLIKPHELPALFAALEEFQESANIPTAKNTIDYIQFLLFTGMRKNEAAHLEWEQVDFSDRSFTVTDTKNGHPLTLPLSDHLFKLLQERSKEAESKYVFHGRDTEKPIGDAKRHWEKIKKISGLDFSPHDLRRTFITIADSLEISAYAIKKLVNHSSSGDVTAGYIVHDVDRLRRPMQQIADKILRLAEQERKSGKVIQIR